MKILRVRVSVSLDGRFSGGLRLLARRRVSWVRFRNKTELFWDDFWRVLSAYEFVPTASDGLMTMSDRVLLTIAFSSACSSPGTLNLSSVC